MQVMRKAGLGLAMAAAGAMVALGGSGSAAAEEGKHGGTLVAAFSADPGGFDPARGPSGMSHVVIEQVYSTLLNLDENAKPYAGIAESWSVAEDGLSWTFTLRPGLMFHNGEALTAEDVVYSFERILDPDSGYAYRSQIETIDEVTAVDELNVRFDLNRVTGPFEIYMAFPGSSIVPKDLVESGWDLNAQPVGSGPFKFISYTPRDSIVFERNDDYYEEGRPVLRRHGLSRHLRSDRPVERPQVRGNPLLQRGAAQGLERDHLAGGHGGCFHRRVALLLGGAEPRARGARQSISCGKRSPTPSTGRRLCAGPSTGRRRRSSEA